MIQLSQETPSSPNEVPSAHAEFEFEVPAFSTVASKLISELNRENVETKQIIGLIECEPTISATVLRLANSPLYSPRRPITTIGNAVVVLGFQSVAQQAIAVASGAAFLAPDSECQTARRATYCQSLGVATVGRLIASEMKWGNSDEAFLCGVLHDIGKLVLFQHAGSEYATLLDQSRYQETPEAELTTFGAAHPALGKRCGVTWGLPHCINLAIDQHHHAIDDVTEPLSKVIIMANYFARQWQVGFDENNVVESQEEWDSQLGLSQVEEHQSRCLDQFIALQEVCLNGA